jgi:hypothetical protein
MARENRSCTSASAAVTWRGSPPTWRRAGLLATAAASGMANRPKLSSSGVAHTAAAMTSAYVCCSTSSGACQCIRAKRKQQQQLAQSRGSKAGGRAAAQPFTGCSSVARQSAPSVPHNAVR